jgi:hypothetical protein
MRDHPVPEHFHGGVALVSREFCVSHRPAMEFVMVLKHL